MIALFHLLARSALADAATCTDVPIETCSDSVWRDLLLGAHYGGLLA